MIPPSKGPEDVAEIPEDRAQEIEIAVAALLFRVEPPPKTERLSRWVATDDEVTAPDSLY